MNEVGGYFELERGYFLPRHKGIYLNSGRNALRLIIRLLKIKHLHVPSYTCPAVIGATHAEGCEVVPYELDGSFMPTSRFPKEDFILANDYFGVTGGKVAELAAEYPNLIVDNAQSYFANPLGRATFYSPRKFFGVPDGGIAVFNRDEVQVPGIETDVSYDRMKHLLKRHDCGATAAYGDFVEAERLVGNAPVLAMSNLTLAILSTIDDEKVRDRRISNFNYLLKHHRTNFPIAMAQEAAPLAFPLVSTVGSLLRKRLKESQIYVATYWPNCKCGMFLCQNILPLPIDQRYDERDMDRILGVINGCC